MDDETLFARFEEAIAGQVREQYAQGVQAQMGASPVAPARYSLISRSFSQSAGSTSSSLGKGRALITSVSLSELDV